MPNLCVLSINVNDMDQAKPPKPCPPGLYSAIRDPFGNVIELLEFTA